MGRRAKSKDFHYDLKGSQGRDIEYYWGRKVKVDVFHVILGVRGLKVLVGGAGPPIQPLDLWRSSDLQFS